jgi:hypothetical protein
VAPQRHFALQFLHPQTSAIATFSTAEPNKVHKTA